MMAFSIMSNRQKQKFRDAAEADIGYGIKGLGRFRINVFRSRMGLQAVMRVVPSRIPTLHDLNLPPHLVTLAGERRSSTASSPRPSARCSIPAAA